MIQLQTIRSDIIVTGNINIRELIGSKYTFFPRQLVERIYHHPLYPNANIKFIGFIDGNFNTTGVEVSIINNTDVKNIYDGPTMDRFYRILLNSIESNVKPLIWKYDIHRQFRPEFRQAIFAFLLINLRYNYVLPTEIMFKIFEMMSLDYIPYQINSVNSRYYCDGLTEEQTNELSELKISVVNRYIFTTSDSFVSDKQKYDLIRTILN